MDGKKILGALFLVGGIAIAIFGLMYINSPQYKAMSMVNGLTGSRSDPTGIIAIGIGAVLGLAGAWSLMAGTGAINPHAPSPDTHVLCPDCREPVRMEASKCKHCGCKLVPQT